jgi:hypothetical protein
LRTKCSPSVCVICQRQGRWFDISAEIVGEWRRARSRRTSCNGFANASHSSSLRRFGQPSLQARRDVHKLRFHVIGNTCKRPPQTVDGP